MLPLAYGQGPGFASSIGGSWDEVLPFGFINQYGYTINKPIYNQYTLFALVLYLILIVSIAIYRNRVKKQL